MREHVFSTAEKVAIVFVFIACVVTVVCGLKPEGYKNASPANIIMQDLDNALTQITANDSVDGTLRKLYKLNSTDEFNVSKGREQSMDLGLLLKKYLKNFDKPCKNSKECGACKAYQYSFLLKNGACVGITTGKAENVPTIFPGEAKPTNSSNDYGVIFFDINSVNAPNEAGKDQFLVPLGAEGIEYVAEE